MTTAVTKKAGKGNLKRAATETRIIKAFEKVLKRDGISNVGVNAVIKEAGVGKGLLYEYFGGLDGLADAWVARSHFIPDAEEIAGKPLDQFLEQSLADQIRDVHINYASMLRKNALAQEIFVEELQPTTKMSKTASHIRAQIGITHESFFTKLTPVSDPDYHALIFTLHAASNYLALRSKTSPVFNGVDMSKDEGWEMLMGMLSTVVDKFEQGKNS
ncbi:TetR/AcrR family transcriptional regulator [Oceanicoccus sagamiensis]|uniref:HTH tetR-type domain-containing protein n=1 Tax=Oceanicoccus sagamiensis TaxID=716816 RepID=A0A1X9NC08_9GAMM|nr:TetR/AcrR family transcriptional regulator [Oceanicoccus sagamiensis]ARN73435.1 hypothetical protein BST96_04490 [Oceanicoccus sagamiensis]